MIGNLINALWTWYYMPPYEGSACEVGIKSVVVGIIFFVIAISFYAYTQSPEDEEWVFGIIISAFISGLVGVGLPVILLASPVIGFFFFFLPWLKDKGNLNRANAKQARIEQQKNRREAERLLDL